MDLKQLSYFVRVAELGSFTRASAALDLAQPTLSRQVRLLEVELRQSLLVRNGRGVTLTEAGQVLLEHARGLLHQVERLHEELAKVRGSLGGRVALGLPPSLARVLTIPITRRFKRQMPHAALAISEDMTSSMQESLLSGRLDIALLYNARPSPDIELRPLLEEELYLVERRATHSTVQAISMTELARIPLIIPSRPHALRIYLEASLVQLGLRPSIAWEIDSVPAILDLVLDGAGSAILPRNAVITSPQPEAYQLRSIMDPALRTTLFMATSARRPKTSTQKAMLELLQATALECFT